jgi:hypothetical protein
MGSHRYRHICSCSKSGNPSIANLVAALLIDLRQAQEAGVPDMNPDRPMADNLRQTIGGDGDDIADLHLWRLGPGHLGGDSVCRRVGGRVGDCQLDFRI